MSQFGLGYYGGSYGGWGGFGGWGYPGSTEIRQPAISQDAKAKPQDLVERQWNTWGYLGGPGFIPGFDKAPPLTIPIMWQMRRYAVIVLAQTVTIGPVLAGVQSIEIANEKDKKDATAEAMLEAAIEDVLPIVHAAMEPGFESLHFGAWLQELVWDRRDGRTYPCEVRSILPGEAIIYRDPYRRFAGYEIAGQFRDPRYGLLTVNNPHIDPIFGESRNSYVREEWWRARNSEENADTTERKAAGRQMTIEIPQGFQPVGPDGKSISQAAYVQLMVNAAARGEAIILPRMFFSNADIIKDPKLADIPLIKVTPIDWGNIGPAIAAYCQRKTTLQADIMMGRMRPTREAMEGSTGTKAEAGVHGQIGVTDSEWVASQQLGQMTTQILDRWAVTNYGPEAKGKLVLRQAPLSDPQQEFLQKLYTALASGQAPDPTLVAQIDPRALGKRLEVPLLEEAEVAAKVAEQEQKQQDQEDAKNAAMAKPMPGGNGTNGNGKKTVGLSAEVIERLSPYL